jgi:cytochrome c-type biogenesis protein CcmF
MNEIKYIGEHLWVGELGHSFVLAAFVSALLAAVCYFLSFKNNTNASSDGWKKIGRFAFYTHSFSLFGLMATIFYAMYNHMYEYSYVFDHVSAELPLKYILSAFWEGQEGSFMLWMFWHSILGLILIRTTGRMEAPVLITIAVAETILMTMILGIYIPWGEEALKIGSNPTTLLRSMNNAPVFSNADYLSLIKGRGLNPLLQNYWMTIHPPTLFLGFASTIVPFAYAFAGLWENDHKTWLKTSLKWSLFSAGILGTGILMGSLWAYVALSFGGYWAWDPVENASLVPWITLVAGIHVHLIAKNTGYATRSVYFFYLVSFILILYSTFLTRSGILGDTSAHAFTEMGLEWQLIFLVMYFIVTGIGLWILRYKSIKNPEKEEELPSREFWMFIGSLVLLFSAVLITTSTSLPVINKLMMYYNPAYEGKVIKDPIMHYNKYQLWIAVFVALLSSTTLFLRYGAVNWGEKKKLFVKKMPIFVLFSIALTWAIALWLRLYSWQFYVMCFSGAFSVVANLDYMVSVVKGKLKLAASAISHLGFGLMIIGLLASGLNQKHISSNPFVFKDIFTESDLKKYVQLIKGKPLYSQGYFITYQSDTLVGRERTYSINFQQLDDSLRVIDEMNLHPNAVYANDFSKVAAFNPDTKNYFSKDIFTCVVGLPPALESVEKAKKIEDSLKYVSYTLLLNDSINLPDFVVKPKSLNYAPSNTEYRKHKHDTGIGLSLSVYNKKADTTYMCEAALGLEGALMYNYPAAIEEAGIRIKLDESLLDDVMTPDDLLEYKEFTIKNGGTFTFGGYNIHLDGFDKNPVHPSYIRQEKDIAVGAVLHITGSETEEKALPLYIIRNNQPMSIKYYSGITGLHLRFSNIDPQREEFSFKIAKDNRKLNKIKLSLTTDVPRTDYLILQATIFPGINLFWSGTTLMLVGLFLASWVRYKSKKQT